MKTYNELAKASKEERFCEVLTFVTTKIKNTAFLEVVKDALLGLQTEDVMFIAEAAIISKLCAKAFISAKQSDCLIEFAKVNESI